MRESLLKQAPLRWGSSFCRLSGKTVPTWIVGDRCSAEEICVRLVIALFDEIQKSPVFQEFNIVRGALECSACHENRRAYRFGCTYLHSGKSISVGCECCIGIEEERSCVEYTCSFNLASLEKIVTTRYDRSR